MAEADAGSFDRFNEALRNLDDQIQELRGRFEGRRKEVEERIRKQADEWQADLRRSGLYRRYEQTWKDVEGAVEKQRSRLYEAFGLASKADIDRLNRKLSSLSRKVSELLKEQASA